MHELVPVAAQIAVILNPKSPEFGVQLNDVQTAARTIGIRLQIARIGGEDEFDAAFATLLEVPVHALLVAGDPFFMSQRARIVALTARHKIPAIYEGLVRK